MPFGVPVVPEENSTHSGWSNGTGVIVEFGASRSSTSAHGVTSSGGLAPSRGTSTVAFKVGSCDRISASSALRSMRLPSYTEPSLATSTFGSSCAEPGDDAADGEVLVAHRPGGADRGGAEERDDGLADVGQVADDAVTGHARRALRR